MYLYNAFGLNIRSDLSLFQLVEGDQQKPCDVEISAGLIDANKTDKKSTIKITNPGTLQLYMPNIALFEISNGNKIVYQAVNEDVDKQSIKLYLLGSCLGVVLHQREQIVLHGCAVKVGDGAVVLVGRSGNGKSTIAAQMNIYGYPILTDDVCSINSQGLVQPSYPFLKLWKNSLDNLNLQPKKLIRIRLQDNKFYYPLDDGFYNHELPISAIYVLNTSDRESIDFKPITGLNKFRPLKRHTYRPNYVNKLGLNSSQLVSIGDLANKAFITRITRPDEGFEIEALGMRIIDDLKEKQLI